LVIWQLYAAWLNNPLLFPTFADTFAAFYEGVRSGVLLERGWSSVKVLS
jgi:NitT/TauT family transport system permease protein